MKRSRLRFDGYIAFIFALIFSFSVWTPGPAAHAAGGSTASAGITADDPAPFIEPTVVNEHAGQKVLFDNTHGQTAGAADWVINGGFSDFGQALADDGYYVKELRQTTPITYDDLKDYDVFVIGEANIPYKTGEQQAMADYVKNGGSIFFIADHYNADRNKNRWDASEVFNGYRRGAYEDPAKGMSAEERASDEMQNVESSDWLSENFGVRFRYNALADITADNIVSPDESFGITEGVNTVAMHAGSTLAITNPHLAKGIVYLPKTDASWSFAVDQGVYDGGGVEEGPFVAISKSGAGKAAFIGDSSPVEDASPKYLREDTGDRKTTYDGFKEQNDGTLLVNTIEWLSKDESYTSLDGKVTLDQPTQLHDFEIPQNSTEPQPEPWAAPDPGYKWYDSSTFKPGSYGSPQAALNPSYSFVHQAQLPSDERVFQIRVAADGFTPYLSQDNFKVGLYLPGGEQVGEFSSDPDTWTGLYGYSTPFSMTADKNGHAVREFYVKIKAGKLGDANLRLKQGSKTLTTESVTISDVAAEPLPDDPQNTVKEGTVNEVRHMPIGQTVKVQGTITTEPGIFGGEGFYMQDETGGIYVFQNAAGYHAGDTVSMTATLDQYNGELELTQPNITNVTQGGPVPDPKVTGAVTEENQGQLITIKNVKISNVHKADNYGTIEMTGDAGQGSFVIRIDNRTGLDFDHFSYKDGDVLNITGASSIFKGAYQLKPRGSADLEYSDKEAPVTTAAVECEKLASGVCFDKATVSLSATDEGTGVKTTEYRIDNGEWQTYSSPLVLKEDGNHIVDFHSTDAAGNTEEVKSITVDVTTATLGHLTEKINQLNTTHGMQQSLLAHLKSIQKHEDKAYTYGLDSSKGQKEWQHRQKDLQNEMNRIEHLKKHFTQDDYSDLMMYYTALSQQ